MLNLVNFFQFLCLIMITCDFFQINQLFIRVIIVHHHGFLQSWVLRKLRIWNMQIGLLFLKWIFRMLNRYRGLNKIQPGLILHLIIFFLKLNFNLFILIFILVSHLTKPFFLFFLTMLISVIIFLNYKFIILLIIIVIFVFCIWLILQLV